MSELRLQLADHIREVYDTCSDDIQRAAVILWGIKLSQMNRKIFFEELVYRELLSNRQRYIEQIADGIRKKCAQFAGVDYRIEDIRDTIATAEDERTIIIVHPPAYKRGYEKQFETPDIVQEVQFAQIDFSAEFASLYAQSKEKPALFVWSNYGRPDLVPREDIVFAEEKSIGKFEYYCATKPHLIPHGAYYKRVVQKPKQEYEQLPIKIIPADYEITEKTQISVKKISKAAAYYYRDLWCHKMATTAAEFCYAVLLDGMLFGVTGLMTRELQRLCCDTLYEVFGFDRPLEKHPNFHRLFMRILTCREFAQYVKRTISKHNRIYEIRHFQTSCITKYRKLKSSTGILNLVSRERLPNGMYHLVYRTPIHKASFREVLLAWLEESKAEVADAR
ncbi:MAG: hypothetical protein ONA90_01280 [candidate division KSB1 bacterium]|nr:hypothetical protein [candidate division KSB1 bacterium]